MENVHESEEGGGESLLFKNVKYSPVVFCRFYILSSVVFRGFLLLFVLNFNGCKSYVQCTDCSGSGEVICTQCGGDKKYEVSLECHLCSNGKTICIECNGKGLLNVNIVMQQG